MTENIQIGSGVGFSLKESQKTYGFFGGMRREGEFNPNVRPWGNNGNGRLRSRAQRANRYGFTGPRNGVMSPRFFSGEVHSGFLDAEKTLIIARSKGMLSGPKFLPTKEEISDLQWTIDPNSNHPLAVLYREEILPNNQGESPPMPDSLSSAPKEIQEAWEMRYFGSKKMDPSVMEACMRFARRGVSPPKVELLVNRMGPDGPLCMVRSGLNVYAFDVSFDSAVAVAASTINEKMDKWDPEDAFEEYLLFLASNINPLKTRQFGSWWKTIKDDLIIDYAPVPPDRIIFGLEL